uniref:Uncharacterized protein n=1 Tax=Panagrolaimus sp. ES5 TaxID=591445 RepID=A0AC34G6I5_9BILA
MFVSYAAFEDFEDYRLYQIPFKDESYTFFIVENRRNSSIPNVNLHQVLASIKDQTSWKKSETAVCVPEIFQQNTYDVSKFINLSAGKELSLMTPFDRPIDPQIVDKYYQAIRFDLRADGLNIKPVYYESSTFDCKKVEQTFVYGIFYNDMKTPGREALLYYGAFL